MIEKIDTTATGDEVSLKELRNCYDFTHALIDWINEHAEEYFGNEISDDFNQIFLKYGLMEKKIFNDELYNEYNIVGDPDEGDEVYVITERGK